MNPKITLSIYCFLTLSLLMLNTFNLRSQDTIYYSSDLDKVENGKEYEYYGFVDFQDERNERAIVKRYYKHGTAEFEAYYSDYTNAVKDGKSREWYNNGQLKSEIEYSEGKKNGTLITYWKNGKVRRNEFYLADNLEEGKCFDSTGVEVKCFQYQVMPTFKGGVEGLMKYLSNNINYPRDAIKKSLEGKVFMSFIVDKKGIVRNVKLLKGIWPSIDAEAFRVVNQMPAWNPGTMEGEPVSVRYQIPIFFKLR